MLLRRMSSHLASQNWLAVVLDFAVVISGVFFAMQAENWYSERRDRAEEQQLLSRLYNDYVTMEAMLQAAVKSTSASFQQTDHLIRIHDGRDPDDHDEAFLSAIVSTAMQTTPLAQPIATQSEMMSSGQVKLIDDRHLLGAFNNFEQRRGFTAAAYQQISETLQPIRFEIYAHMSLDDKLDEEGNVVFGGVTDLDTDWLMTDPDIYRSLTLMRRMNGQYLRLLQDLEDMAHSVVVRLEEELGVEGRHDEFLHAEPVAEDAVDIDAEKQLTGTD